MPIDGPNGLILTEEEIVVVEKLAGLLQVEMIADYLGISRATFFNIRKRQPELDVRYKRGESRVVAKVANSLVIDAIKGDVTSRIFYLKTRGRWSVPREAEAPSRDAATTIDVSHLPVEKLEQLHALLRDVADIAVPDDGYDRSGDFAPED
jgi:hypothetical protein